MSEYGALRARGNLSGWYTRPAGSDGVGPPVGTRVDWVAAQPVQDMLVQGKRYGWKNLGTIGNTAHLQRHGDHTAHSKGKIRGVVYAKDTALPNGGKAALLKLCRLDRYDTRYIDFFNIANEQYNFAGVKQGWSPDVHLHVSIRRGFELRSINLFDDIAAVLADTFGQPTPVPMPDIFNRLGFIDGASLVTGADPAIWLAGRGIRTQVKDMTELAAIQKYMRSRGMNDDIHGVDVLPGTVVS